MLTINIWQPNNAMLLVLSLKEVTFLYFFDQLGTSDSWKNTRKDMEYH